MQWPPPGCGHLICIDVMPWAEQEREPVPDYSPPASSEAAMLPSFSASEGRRDAQGRLVFEDRPDFRPNLTPKQVIQAGSFGGWVPAK